MHVPREDVKVCTQCGADVVEAITSKKQAGEPVKVLLEVDEDQLNETPSKQWVLSQRDGRYFAGQPLSKNQRAGMIASGVRFHLSHAAACADHKAKNRHR